MRWPSVHPHIGVALTTDHLAASLPDGRQLEVSEVSELQRAFEELSRAARTKRATVSVALVPPLVKVRHIMLPPLREDERRRILARDALRYFAGTREPHVVASVVVKRKATSVVFVAAAPAILVEEIEAAVTKAGWVLAAIVPAQSAWAVAGHEHVIARLECATEVLRVERGCVAERRQIRRTAVIRPDLHDRIELENPVTAAARNASAARGPDLCSDARQAVRQRRARLVAGALACTALLCALLAAVVDYWGIRHELTAVRDRRAELGSQVAAAMQQRDSLSALTGSLVSLGTLDATAPRWSELLTDLAVYLPIDAHIVTLRGRGDTVVVEGVAGHAIGVFQALERMPRVTAVRAAAPIRQHVAINGTTREQFAVSARLVQQP